jgi:hypothetical protein
VLGRVELFDRSPDVVEVEVTRVAEPGQQLSDRADGVASAVVSGAICGATSRVDSLSKPSGHPRVQRGQAIIAAQLRASCVLRFALLISSRYLPFSEYTYLPATRTLGAVEDDHPLIVPGAQPGHVPHRRSPCRVAWTSSSPPSPRS